MGLVLNPIGKPKPGHEAEHRKLFNRIFNKDDAEKEILEGRAHAYVSTLPAVQFVVMNNSDAIDLPLSEPLVGWAEALAVRKGEPELLNFLNAWVTARKADRWLNSTRDYWFESLDWTKDVKSR